MSVHRNQNESGIDPDAARVRQRLRALRSRYPGVALATALTHIHDDQVVVRASISAARRIVGQRPRRRAHGQQRTAGRGDRDCRAAGDGPGPGCAWRRRRHPRSQPGRATTTPNGKRIDQ